MRREDVQLFTITTSGYIPLTKNLIASLEEVGLEKAMTVYCLDSESMQNLSETAIRCKLIETETLPTFAQFMGKGFNKIVAMKFIVALQLMEKGQHPLYVDGDIIFLRDPVLLMLEKLQSHDLVMQSEAPKDFCNTGFWLARSTSSVRSLFHKMVQELQSEEIAEDQIRFNQHLQLYQDVAVHRLPVDQFVAGNLIFSGEYQQDNAYVLHYNFTRGMQNKIEQMRDFQGIRDPDLLTQLTK